MKWWLKFGCFLTGYNYNIIKASSEVAAKVVKRYTAAMVIICILWSFVGFTFTDRYMKAGLLGSIFGAVILCIIIIQVERQIILSVHRNRALYFFRAIIAITMAVLGTIIIDQIIFKEDIELKKITILDDKVNAVFNKKSEELRKQIRELDTSILNKETERKLLVIDINQNPTIQVRNTQHSIVPVSIRDSNRIDRIEHASSTTRSTTSIQNPKISLLQPLDQQIESIRKQKYVKDSMLLVLRPAIENDIKTKVGFLDELEVMASIILTSKTALFIWALWFVFLLGLELFILVSKIGEKASDYDEIIKHQMTLHLKRIQLLAKAGGESEKINSN